MGGVWRVDAEASYGLAATQQKLLKLVLVRLERQGSRCGLASCKGRAGDVPLAQLEMERLVFHQEEAMRFSL